MAVFGVAWLSPLKFLACGDGHVGGLRHIEIEIPDLAAARVVRQADDAGAVFGHGAGFVEAYLAAFADTDDQQVEVARDFVEFRVVFGDFVAGDPAVQDVDILVEDIHLVEQGLVQLVVAALGSLRIGRVVFIDGNDFDVLERDFAGFVAAGQLVVKGQGRPACAQAQAVETAFRLVDGFDDDVGHGVGGRMGVVVDVCPDFFVGVENAFRQVFFDETALVGQRKMIPFHSLVLVLQR